MRKSLLATALAAAAFASQAAVIDTTDAATVAAFQQGLTVETFEDVATRTPQAIDSYGAGTAVGEAAQVYDQVAGLRWSVGGMVGVNRPALFKLEGDLAGDAHSGSVVLGPVSFDGATEFDHIIELYLPQKVSKVGFWLNPSLADVLVLALDNNFAFTGNPDENVLESGTAKAGTFFGFERASADIASLKFQVKTGGKGITIDDFSFGGFDTGGGDTGGGDGGGSSVPEPGTAPLLALGGLIALARRRQRRPEAQICSLPA